MFVNALPRYEVLGKEAMAALDRGWRRIAPGLSDVARQRSAAPIG